jgi:hypothetical protein
MALSGGHTDHVPGNPNGIVLVLNRRAAFSRLRSATFSGAFGDVLEIVDVRPRWRVLQFRRRAFPSSFAMFIYSTLKDLKPDD